MCVVVLCLGTATPAIARDKNTKAAAVDAFERYVDQLNKRQWVRLYARLTPVQKADITASRFSECMDERPDAELTVDEIVETYRERAIIPGTSVEANTVAITVKATARIGSRSQSATDTVHQIYANGRWTFALDAEQFDNCSSSLLDRKSG